MHYLTNVVALAENSCAYDIDQVDEAWLKLYNADRKQYGAFPISETQFERVIEELEVRLFLAMWENVLNIKYTYFFFIDSLLGANSGHFKK